MSIRQCVVWWLGLTALRAAHAEQPTVVNFDSVDAAHGRVLADDYLAEHGITLSEVSSGTIVAIANAKDRFLAPSSPPNVLTQVNSNDPVSFTLNLPAPVESVQFTRPGLVAGPTGITFPEWQAQALNAKGEIVAEAGEPLGSGKKYYSDVPARTFTLSGPEIVAVRFRSNNHHFAGFSAVVIDDLTLVRTGAGP